MKVVYTAHGRLLAVLCGFFACLLFNPVVSAEERHSDPDGCFSCHALEGLQSIDADGVLHVSSIDKSHYYSSLHGSVPCKDCHRKITHYPHEVENGYVDCSESCHVDEPSEGEAFSHEPIVKEFEQSVHGEGWSKEFAVGNRLQEDSEEQDPSCRRCHSNTLYILEDQLEKFKQAFMHTDTECGTCHQGDVWRNQFGGHILRRLIGSRWKKRDNNAMCEACHGDHERMAKVEIEDPESKQKHKADFRWIHASDSYQKSLHHRLLATGIEAGASCIDCHAPVDSKGFRHDILADEDEKSATHADNLTQTCAQSSCHEFALNTLNSGFVTTDLHDIDQVRIEKIKSLFAAERLDSNWQWSFLVMQTIALAFLLGCIYWLFWGCNKKNQAPIIGDQHFEKYVIGRKGKKGAKRQAKVAKPSKKSQKKVAEKNLVATADAKKPGDEAK